MLNSITDFRSSNHESGIDSKIRVLIAEKQEDNGTRILESLEELKECEFSLCNDPANFFKVIADFKPALLLINFDFIKEDSLKIIHSIRHSNVHAYVTIYLPRGMEETQNMLSMAGARSTP
jgi:PleD family two-component response regulator